MGQRAVEVEEDGTEPERPRGAAAGAAVLAVTAAKALRQTLLFARTLVTSVHVVPLRLMKLWPRAATACRIHVRAGRSIASGW